MAITVDDLEYDASANTDNLGGALGSALARGAANNLWADVSITDCTTGQTFYHCIYVQNKHASLAWQQVVVWVDAAPAQGSVAIGLDGATVGSTASSSAATVTTAPSPTVTFSAAASKATGLSIGDIPNGSYKALWLRRTIPAGASADPDDGISIRAEGLTLTP